MQSVLLRMKVMFNLWPGALAMRCLSGYYRNSRDSYRKCFARSEAQLCPPLSRSEDVQKFPVSI
jgi:hypothetical protein